MASQSSSLLFSNCVIPAHDITFQALCIVQRLFALFGTLYRRRDCALWRSASVCQNRVVWRPDVPIRLICILCRRQSNRRRGARRLAIVNSYDIPILFIALFGMNEWRMMGWCNFREVLGWVGLGWVSFGYFSSGKVHKGWGFESGQGYGFLRAIKISSTPSFGWGVKPEVPCSKILQHVKALLKSHGDG
jgi:hypothetical protein